MTNTERKLDEARYFFNQLNTNLPYFDYILSAYLNAARSTSWIMRHEFSKIEGWEKWFKECEVSSEEKLLLQQINDLRIKASKQSGVKTEYLFMDYLIPNEKYYPDIEEMLKEFEGEEIEVTISTNIPDKDPDPEEGVYRIRARAKMEKNESETSRDSIYNLCKQYFAFLEQKVNHCVEKFKL